MNKETNLNFEDKVRIPSNEVEFSSTIRLLDKNGRVFFWNGQVFRAIYPDRASFINKLFDDGIVEHLASNKLLIPTERTNYFLDGFGLILRHEKLDFYVNGNELALGFLLDAYKYYLSMYIYLYGKGYTLADGHLANIAAYKDGSPIFIDFGSIINRSESVKTGLFESFSCFYYKLCLTGKGVPTSFLRKLSGNLTRYEYLMLVSPMHRFIFNGITKFENISIFRSVAHLTKSFLYSENIEYFKSFTGIFRLMALINNKRKGQDYSYNHLDQTAERILAKILQLKHVSKKTYWSDYHEGLKANSSITNRHQAVIDQVKNISAKGLLDIGANAGAISNLLYPYCEYILSVDYDEDAVDKNYQRLMSKGEGKRIYPIVKNVVTMSKGDRIRYQQDVVIALALTHHLRLGQKYSFDYISELFSDITTKLLVVEFMPKGLNVNESSGLELPSDYTLDNFIQALQINFSSVENLGVKTEDGASPRNMLVCKK